MRYLIFILVLAFAFSAFGQKEYHKKAENLFLASDSCVVDGNGIYYVKIENSETVTSQLQLMKEGRSGNIRVSTWIDTISGDGTPNIIIQIGQKVTESGGVDSLEYIYTAIDTLTGNRALSTKEITDFGINADPFLGYVIRILHTETAVIRVYTQVIEYKP